MKKTYEKPTFVRKGKLSATVAAVVSLANGAAA
ncbi:putative RiPP precursor [Mesorhizobium silamurunense]|nr:putative RiPP precursor [Mesorhizobium silamurunense]